MNAEPTVSRACSQGPGPYSPSVLDILGVWQNFETKEANIDTQIARQHLSC